MHATHRSPSRRPCSDCRKISAWSWLISYHYVCFLFYMLWICIIIYVFSRHYRSSWRMELCASQNRCCGNVRCQATNSYTINTVIVLHVGVTSIPSSLPRSRCMTVSDDPTQTRLSWLVRMILTASVSHFTVLELFKTTLLFQYSAPAGASLKPNSITLSDSTSFEPDSVMEFGQIASSNC